MTTKRIFEAAREYGVPTKSVIQKLAEHNIKAGNFTGVDDKIQSILDKSFKGKKQGDAPKPQQSAGRQGGKTPQAAAVRPPQQREARQRKATDAADGRQQRQKDRSVRQMPDNRSKQSGNQNGQQRDGQQGAQRHGQSGKNGAQQNRGNRQNTANGRRNQQTEQRDNRAGGAVQGTQGGQHKQGEAKRTKYFGHSQQSGDSGHGKGGRTQNHGNKNGGNAKGSGSRPHTLLSNVLNKGKGKKNKNNRQAQHNQQNQVNAAPARKKNYPTAIELPEMISVKDFAEKLGREVGEVIKRLLMGGIMATINQEIDYDTAVLIADEFNVAVTMEAAPEDPTEIEEIIDAEDSLQTRPPVVTIMGHVDHGKTSLLDAIRETNVTSHEAGGITQHIGAYQVRYKGRKIVFMDTPGHEAFTAMRARGAQVTDIAVLVVAADDGVMPQTIESINHAKSAGVPVIVAINKIDKESAAPQNVMQQLTEYGLISEDWGGDTIMVPVSAHTKIGLDELLENILVLAEVSDLKANPHRPAQGVVIEAKLDKGRGPVASVLIQKGTLHVGDTIIVGTCFGKVRAMNSERGERVKKAEPSIPVEILGLNDVPEAGDILHVTDEKTARSVAEKRAEKKRSSELHVNAKVTLDDLFNQIQQGELKELSLIVKGDVQGSVEALSQSLMAIKSDEVRISIVHSGVGAITESDIMLASASNALIIGFNVRPDAAARKAAERETVDMRTYRVIYDAINDVEAAIKGMLDKKYEEHILGRAEVRKVITTPKVIVGGSYIKEGKITNSSKIRLIRNGIVVHEGEVDGLRRFKDDVKEVVEGYECGITLENYRDIKEGDEIEAYEMVEVAPE
ncbi:translation initiation factor IF-2 [Megasphaera vaginalis (ex Srinivasan et al. 2021)]|uniref:Translation initiation factor IF-2 n=1 Tax=Megasphaera vaginalis (ex Srinivasan et al. 2021) TaxID=1111454 RepID=U7UCT7_9FIRM|nr:translation initiation factor IF-2 [Megasphaera vaginalis (ex Srinivasan et al. 2021)]ERT57155.1 translation initiation factor IF-2 [Megasphaera vaginalis (ex Srinivasan et al. 2021)]